MGNLHNQILSDVDQVKLHLSDLYSTYWVDNVKLKSKKKMILFRNRARQYSDLIEMGFR